MVNTKECVFCDTPSFKERVIRSEELFISFVSRPWFREGHCLVIPRRHITRVAELEREESADIMEELGRLTLLLDEQGFGSGIMQKYLPRQTENGVKVNHLHFHANGRDDDEAIRCENEEPMLFTVPQPNSFDGFEMQPLEKAAAFAQKLRP